MLGLSNGRAIQLADVLDSEGQAYIGRSIADIFFPPSPDTKSSFYTAISKRHALFRINGHNLEVKDHSSKNGTYVNGLKLQPDEWKIVKDGDSISFGWYGKLKSNVIWI